VLQAQQPHSLRTGCAGLLAFSFFLVDEDIGVSSVVKTLCTSSSLLVGRLVEFVRWEVCSSGAGRDVTFAVPSMAFALGRACIKSSSEVIKA
jgi:hypothetical protein